MLLKCVYVCMGGMYGHGLNVGVSSFSYDVIQEIKLRPSPMVVNTFAC